MPFDGTSKSSVAAQSMIVLDGPVAEVVEIDVAVISGGVTLSRHAARSMH
jgi:hypothetical protein